MALATLVLVCVLRVTPAAGAPSELPTRGRNVGVVVNVSARATGTPRRALDTTLLRALRSQLARQPRVNVDAHEAPKFVIDGVITRLDRVLGRPWVEVTCEVKLTISTGAGKIVSMVSGRATVQTPRSHYRPAMDASLEADAVLNAVLSANQRVLEAMRLDRVALR